jgi:hypothetical protein
MSWGGTMGKRKGRGLGSVRCRGLAGGIVHTRGLWLALPRPQIGRREATVEDVTEDARWDIVPPKDTGGTFRLVCTFYHIKPDAGGASIMSRIITIAAAVIDDFEARVPWKTYFIIFDDLWLRHGRAYLTLNSIP